MKVYLISIVYFALFVSSAFANVCGLIELEDGSLLQLNRGKIYDLNEQLVAVGVPVDKKVLVSNSLGSGVIQNSKGKGNKKQVKIEFKLNSGKKLTAVVNQAGSLVYFDTATNSFVLLKLNESIVARAKFAEGSAKLKFVESFDAFFSKDSCKNF